MIMSKVICAVLFGCISIASSGCASEDATKSTLEEGSVASVSSELGVCPATTALKIDRQRRATDILAYIFGDNSKAPSDFWVKSDADQLRREIASGQLVPSRSVSKTACGLPAAYVRFDCAASNSFCMSLDYLYFDYLAQDAEIVWPGILPFMHLSGGGSSTAYVEFDPEPAVLTSSLSGGAGSSASAVFVNSNAPTSARKWSSTWTSCTLNCPAGGQPCSSYTLYSGSSTSSEIQKSGNYYKCL